MWNSVVEVAYVGRRGLHQVQSKDINQPIAGSVQTNPGVNVNALRPYKGFASIQMETSDSNSMYNALQLNWSRRLSKGLAFGFSYTLSKSLDGSSTYRTLVPDSYNTRNLWGPSEFDTRHAVVIHYIYELPLFRSTGTTAGKLLGGWQISGVTQFQTGTPCGVGSANDYAGVGAVGSFGCGNAGQYWVINGTPTVLKQFSNSASSPNQYFAVTNSSGQPIFTPPAAGAFNLQPGVRDSIHGPGSKVVEDGHEVTLDKLKRASQPYRDIQRFLGEEKIGQYIIGPGLLPVVTAISKDIMGRKLLVTRKVAARDNDKGVIGHLDGFGIRVVMYFDDAAGDTIVAWECLYGVL
jgi:hypothetical protein